MNEPIHSGFALAGTGLAALVIFFVIFSGVLLIARSARNWRAYLLGAAIFAQYPWAMVHRWLMADVTLMAAFQFGNPLTVFVLMVGGNR